MGKVWCGVCTTHRNKKQKNKISKKKISDYFYYLHITIFIKYLDISDFFSIFAPLLVDIANMTSKDHMTIQALELIRVVILNKNEV